MTANHSSAATLKHIDRLCGLIGIAVTVAILFGGFSIDRLIAGRTAEMRELRNAAEESTARAETIERELASLTIRCDEANQALSSLKVRLTDTPNESSFNADLAEAAADSDMKVKGFRPGRRVVVNGLGELDVQVSCCGSYEAHCDFLDRLRNLPRVCPVAGLKITAGDDGGSQLHSEIQIRLLFGDAARLTADATSGASPR